MSLLFLFSGERKLVMNVEGQVRIPSGCAIAAMISKEGNKVSGEKIIEAMKPMHDRSNGLGGGFAAYGIYPDYKDFYAFHLFFNDRDTRKNCEKYLREGFEIVKSEIIPTRKIPAIRLSRSKLCSRNCVGIIKKGPRQRLGPFGIWKCFK